MQPQLQWTAANVFGTTFLFGILILAVFLAWRNIRLGRGDTRGASRLAAFGFMIGIIGWLCGESHVPTPHEFQSFLEGLNQAFTGAASFWIFYVALEPYVRRRWPQIMITWSRLLGGRVRDPLVGGHLLIGMAFGIGMFIVAFVFRLLREQSGVISVLGLRLDSMLDARHMAFVLNDRLAFSMFATLILLLFFFLLRAIFRRLWVAAAVFIVFLTVLDFSPESTLQASLLTCVNTALISALFVFILIRFGILSLMAGYFVFQILRVFPVTADFSTWYAGSSIFAMASVLVLTAYALYTALAGRPLFRAGFLDSD